MLHTNGHLQQLLFDQYIPNYPRHQSQLLHWQPIVNLKNSQVHTLEALVRWRRSDEVLLMPKDFMSIAEDSGLIIDLGRWVIREACSAGALTEERSVSVNVSASQLRDVRFVENQITFDQHRDLVIRVHHRKVFGLVMQIDVNNLEVHTFFIEHVAAALTERAGGA